ncbi:MAG: DEAD/DEAH box helicase [Flavobacteriales bacterium]|nr:DEAD/DEAH box helicase [Flavobacteriales bacterium]
MTFKDLGLRPEVLQALNDLGFENPTPIQEEAIPELLSSQRDLVGLAQTGTGKTAAFGLPLIELTDFTKKHVQALIVAPTRELGMQIASDMKTFTKHVQGARVATIYGGASIDKQAKEIRGGAQIVVATPGRLIDMMKRKIIKLSEVNVVVLDEADEMLNMGFKEDIDSILEQTPEQRNVWLFSATMPKEVAKIAKNYMSNPFEVTVGTKNTTAANLEHVYYTIKERDRYHALKRILDLHPNIYGVIFCRTKRATQEVADKLMQDGYSAEPLHGDLSQGQRDAVMGKFRKRTIQMLVATDVAARGIDVNDITHVVNYNLPEEVENYTHRSGRTARAGKHGISVALVSPREIGKIKSIERIIGKEFEKGEIPSGDEVSKAQLFHLIETVKTTEVKEELGKYLPAILEQFEDLEKEDIIKLFVSSEFNPMLEYYQKSYDLNASVSARDRERGDRDGGRDRGRNRDRNDENKQRFHVNQGEESGLNKGAVLRLVCQHSDISSGEVGRIDLFREFSFFEVDKKFADQVLQGMRGAEFNGEGLKVEFAGDKKGGSRSRDSRGGSRGGNRGGSRGGGGYKGSGGGSRSGGGSSHRKGNSGGTGGGDRSRRRRRG